MCYETCCSLFGFTVYVFIAVYRMFRKWTLILIFVITSTNAHTYMYSGADKGVGVTGVTSPPPLHESKKIKLSS